jgi:hypothetical protein
MRESTDATRIGANRTGLQMSPLHAKDMLETLEDVAAPSATEDGQVPMARERQSYIADAEPLGSMPAPATRKGVAKAGVQGISGNRPQALLDKLGERLAFERGGTRLWDALIDKYEIHGDELARSSMADFVRIREDEASHALLLAGCIERLGGDPTAQTPCADLVGVQAAGLLQAVADPRTSLAQSLNAILTAELADNAGWELLITLAERMSQSEMAREFGPAAQRESEHLSTVRGWVEALTLEAAKVG